MPTINRPPHLQAAETPEPSSRPEVGRCLIVARQKCGCGASDLAAFDVRIAGLGLKASLRQDGELILPPGVHPPADVRAEIEAAAQQAVLAALVELWAKRRNTAGGAR